MAPVPRRATGMVRSLVLLWTLLTFALLSTTCSESTTPSPDATSTAEPTVATPSPTASPQHTATPVPITPLPTPITKGRYGGTLNLVSRETIIHQDVHQEVSPALSTWGPGIVYSRLLRFTSGPDVELPSLAVECELCESWTLEDEKTYVFQLRQGVQWQELSPVNGRDLISDDIVFSYNRQRQPGWSNAALLAAVRQLEAPRLDEVRITLAGPDADFLISLADGHSKIVAREAVEVNGDLKSGPTIGTGPWVLTNARPGASHTFESNPAYFEEGLPFISRLVIHVVSDRSTREAAFKVGSIDILEMEPHEWEEFQQKRPDAPFLMTENAGVGLEVALKTSMPPFDDVQVRRAVFQAIDPWQAIGDIWLGSAYVSLGFPIAEAQWALPEEQLNEFFGRPELARELLGEAGVGLPLAVSIKVGDFGDAYLAHAQRIADDIEAVGFEPILEVVDRRVFGQEVWLGGDYQMFVGPVPPVATPNGYLISVLHSQGQWNTAKYRDGALDSLIEAQAQELDPAERRRLVQEIQRHVLENAYRFMPATRVSIWTWQPRVKNFYPNFAGFEYSHWSQVWVED